MSKERFLGLTKEQFALGLLVVNVVLVLVAVATLAFAISASRTRDAAISARVALSHASWCAVKANAQNRVEQTTRYLAEHPGPEPIPGISRATLLDSLHRTTAFRDSIREANCP